MLKDSTFNTNPFSKSDVKEAAQEFNLISMDNNEDELGDIEWKLGINSKTIMLLLLELYFPSISRFLK